MQPSAICLRICSKLFTLDTVLTSQPVDITQRIAKSGRSGDIDNRSIRIRERKRAELPYVARPPATILNEFIRITPGRTRQQYLHLVEKRICRTDAIEQCRRCSAKHGIRFNDRNGGCQLKDAILDAEVIPICRVGVDVVIESNDHLFFHECVGASFIPFFRSYKQASVMMSLEYREE